MTSERTVVALGASALLRRGDAAELAVQRENVAAAAAALAVAASEAELVVTHGNGPQVGLLALEADAYKSVKPYALDVLGAESQGMIGYLLVHALRNELPGREIASVLTQVTVDPDDPAFAHPSKPIGPTYSEREARVLAREHDWTMARDGAYLRRVVPSPRPQAIVELDAIERLVVAGVLVVCAGGGGIPVVRREGRLTGIEAVIDKDATAALLAESLGAQRLVIATDVPYVEREWKTPRASIVESASPRELQELGFAPESMGPKVAAACRFVERTGGSAAIGALSDLERLVRGSTGTQIALERSVTIA